MNTATNTTPTTIATMSNTDVSLATEMDSVFELHENGTFTPRDDLYAPEWGDAFDNGTYEVMDSDWEAVTGFSITGGELMESCEYLDAHALTRLLETEGPGVYTTGAVNDGNHAENCDEDDHDQCDTLTNHWVILKHK